MVISMESPRAVSLMYRVWGAITNRTDKLKTPPEKRRWRENMPFTLGLVVRETARKPRVSQKARLAVPGLGSVFRELSVLGFSCPRAKNCPRDT